MAGFGFSAKPGGYGMAGWVEQLDGFLTALGLERVSLVGNSFGGGLAIAFADRWPARVDKLVLMGSMGVEFPITDGLDAVWGYEPSIENMRRILDLFAYDRGLVNDELAELRHHASTEPGVQEAFSSMFPAPRQRWVASMATPEDRIAALPHDTLVVHGRDDRIIPLQNALRLLALIERSQLHVFGRCGHWTQIEHAARFNELVLDFLRD
jgi:2-hydroxymuconate-semialdehyde hydrolase